MNALGQFLKLDLMFAHNSLEAWLVALIIAVGISVAARIIKRVAIRKISKIARRTETRIDDVVVKALQATRLWLVVVVAIAFGCQNLVLPGRAQHSIDVAATLAVFLQVGLWLSTMLKLWIENTRARAMSTDVGAATSLSALSFVGRVMLWAVVLLLLLDNLGVNVTTLVASLGVGGIAVGFALQNILGDLFASLSIILDKPFVIGDFLIVDSYLGTVENIGIKTTRLRSLGGELLVFANGDLIKSRVRNYRHMRERRILFNVRVSYETAVEKLEWIPNTIKTVISTQPNVRFDRAHFASFGESSLDFEVVYWMLTPDYTAFRDTQQAINLAIVREFDAAGVRFGYPRRTLHQNAPIQVELADVGGRAVAGNPA